MNNASSLIYLRTDIASKTGTYPIYYRIILNRKKRYYSLHIRVKPDQWNKKNQELNSKASNFEMYNAVLMSYKAKVFNLIVTSTIAGKRLELSDFDVIFKGEPRTSNSFYDFVEREITLSQTALKKDTIKNYRAQISKLRVFRETLDFEDITVFFLKSYQKYLLEVLGNRVVTTHKALVFIKSMFNKAVIEKLVADNPFDRFSIGTAPDGTKERLTRVELKKLESLYYGIMPANLRKVLRYFLFSCYTGLRYRDLLALTYGKIVDRDYIYLHMQKTGKPVRIDLPERAKKLLGVGKEKDLVFEVSTDQDTNRKLKEIMVIAGIHKNISIHCARHTFASLASELGMDTLVIKRILGHSNIQTTLIYTKVSDATSRKSMMLLDNF